MINDRKNVEARMLLTVKCFYTYFGSGNLFLLYDLLLNNILKVNQ